MCAISWAYKVKRKKGKFKPGGKAGAIGYLVGKPGGGLACMFHMMNEARIGVGMGAVMYGYRGYLASLQYARERLQGRPLRHRRLLPQLGQDGLALPCQRRLRELQRGLPRPQHRPEQLHPQAPAAARHEHVEHRVIGRGPRGRLAAAVEDAPHRGLRLLVEQEPLGQVGDPQAVVGLIGGGQDLVVQSFRGLRSRRGRGRRGLRGTGFFSRPGAGSCSGKTSRATSNP